MFPYQELASRLKLDIIQHAGHADFLDGPLSSDMSIEVVRSVMLHRSFLKKLAPNGQSPAADAKALEKFLGLNAGIGTEPFRYHVESEQDSLFWDFSGKNS
jgi:hypothetical protein